MEAITKVKECTLGGGSGASYILPSRRSGPPVQWPTLESANRATTELNTYTLQLKGGFARSVYSDKVKARSLTEKSQQGRRTRLVGWVVGTVGGG